MFERSWRQRRGIQRGLNVAAMVLFPTSEPKEARKHLMVALDLNQIIQYAGGVDLLLDTLVEHERLLWELEHEAEGYQPGGSLDTTHRWNLVKAQILLFERLMIGEKINTLSVLVNHYADTLSTPQIEL